MPGLAYFSGQYVAFTFEGRSFALLPTADYASTTAYEIVAGAAVKRFTATGWIFDMFKVR